MIREREDLALLSKPTLEGADDTAVELKTIMKRSHHSITGNSRSQFEAGVVLLTIENENGQAASSDPSGNPHDPATVISVENAIDRLGMGLFQYRIILASGLCFAADAMENVLISFLSTALQVELHLTPNQTASIASSVFAGATIGTLLLGPLSDRIGRRPVFLSAALIISFFGVATALVPPSFPLLIVTRFCVGLGLGGSTIPFDTLAEFLPSMKRGRNLLCIYYFWTAGTLLVTPVAYLSFGHSEVASQSWRLFCFLCALPCVASTILGYYLVPESPRWLCTHGRPDEALAILKRAAEVNGHTLSSSRHPHGLNEYHAASDFPFPDGVKLLSTAVEKEEEHSLNFAKLLSKKWRILTFKLWGVWMSFSIGYIGTILTISRVFSTSDEKGEVHEELQEEDHAISTTREYDFDYGAIFQSSAGEILGLTIAVFSIDRVGRIPSQTVSYGVGGLCLFCLCYLADNDNWDTKVQQQGVEEETGAPIRYIILVVLSFLARAFEMSASCVTWVSTAEILTTEIRTSGHSAANAMARFGAMVIPFLMVESTPLTTVGYFMLFVHAIAIFCTCLLPETKGVAMGAGMEKTR